MRKKLLLLALGICSLHINGQSILLREGVVINNTDTGTWYGDNIPRDVPTKLTYRNNSITSVNTNGYMVQAGDDWVGPNNNNLDNEIVTGNKLVWKGENSEKIITHGLMLGYNINALVKFNYVDSVPYGIIFKSGTDDGYNMTFTSGGCAYNICRNGKFAVRMKGINGVKVYNNTFYNDDNSGWYFVFISANMDREVKTPSTGARVFNNIFYSTSQFPMIKIESGSFADFECDYNLYWCTESEPTFMVDGVSITWAQWKALGYDTHSVIADPKFINSTDLIPSSRLNYGKTLNSEWITGLSTISGWITGKSPEVTNQNGLWQVGARVYAACSIPVNKVNISGGSEISISKGTLQLTATTLPANASIKSVIWSIENDDGVATISSSGLVQAIKNGAVIVRATANDGSGIYQSVVVNISNQNSLSDGFTEINESPFFVKITLNELFVFFRDLKFLSYNVFVYNMQGVMVGSWVLSNEETRLNIAHLPTGIYSMLFTRGSDKKQLNFFKP